MKVGRAVEKEKNGISNRIENIRIYNNGENIRKISWHKFIKIAF